MCGAVERREHHRLLVGGGDPERVGVARVVEAALLAVDQDLALIGRDDAGQDLDQGRLAGAVLTEHSEHLARAQIEVDTPQCVHAAEPPADAP
jgi:hypothetical protein